MTMDMIEAVMTIAAAVIAAIAAAALILTALDKIEGSDDNGNEDR